MTKREGGRVIIKLGGSLIEKGRDIVQFLKDYVEEKDKDRDKAPTLILIPGGGPFVEVVRNLSADISISEESAHWMAVLAMHQYGLFLANGEIGIPLVESTNEIDEAEPIRILLPYEIIKADDCLPHTWNVTSDTIAAFVANKIGEKTFIKITDVDGIIDEKGHLINKIYAKELAELEEKGCVDAELPRYLMRNKMSCTIVNGNYPNRIIAAIEGKETLCTKILTK
ncbi:MAG: hypothetical protein N2V75_02130 [Methanophagales archaeon]|nr:hypothetical protein [Methanophagales archaeon]RLG35095.1 MAG: amino acid kinase [Methanosarcinales archaeon]